MAKQTINIGASANDGTGTPLRTSFDYCNLNFTELYTAVGPSGNNIVCPGSATITGNLTVDTNTLFVDSVNNRVGIGTATPIGPLDIRSNGNIAALFLRTTDPAAAVASAYIQAPVSTGFSSTVPVYGFWYQNSGMGNPAADTLNWIIASGEAMRLNSTGLGVGVTPSGYRLHVRAAFASTVGGAFIESGEFNQKGFVVNCTSASLSANIVEFQREGAARLTLDASGNLILQSSATPATLTINGQLTVNATSNTNLRFSYRGSDGTTRVANITLA